MLREFDATQPLVSEETRIMDGAISAIPKGFYLIVGGKLATYHNTLRDAQAQLALFVQSVPNTVGMICEVIPREAATNRHWTTL